MMHPLIQKLYKKIIVSTQAYSDTPLFGPTYMKAMAESALKGGAAGIRACYKADIAAIRSLGEFPLIGIDKVDPALKSGVFITPNITSAINVIEAGADIVGVDARINQHRSYQELYNLLKEIKSLYPDILIMADCVDFKDAQYAEASGLVDILATTLSEVVISGKPDLALINAMKSELSLPVNGEGGIWELGDLKAVLAAGADMVTIGTAISRPHLITERFVLFNEKTRGER